jgi:hypothetical protein
VARPEEEKISHSGRYRTDDTYAIELSWPILRLTVPFAGCEYFAGGKHNAHTRTTLV